MEETYKIQTRKSTRNLAVWTFAWVISMAIATFGPEFVWSNKILTIFFILVNLILGIGMIMANIRFINGLDELQKKIHLDAMGIALGVSVVGGLAYSLLDITNVISKDAEISHLVMGVAISYLITVVIGVKRYQ